MTSTPDGGPYLTAALFCERVLNETDAVLSAIRIVDRLTVAAVGANLPDALPLVQTNLWYLLSFRSGRAHGRHTIVLEMEKPDGTRTSMHRQDVLFEGEERGTSLALQIQGPFPLEGLYWVHVFLKTFDDVEQEHITQTPLRIMYERSVPRGG